MTRREWLKRNPPPREARGLRDLIAQTADAARLRDLNAELGRAAKCPQHNADLVRHGNRPEDLYVCSNGPHFFLWTRVGRIAAFVAADLSKELPGLDSNME